MRIRKGDVAHTIHVFFYFNVKKVTYTNTNIYKLNNTYKSSYSSWNKYRIY
jgi:hypothetical protein